MLTGKLSWGEEDGAVVHIKAYQTNVGYDLHSKLSVKHQDLWGKKEKPET